MSFLFGPNETTTKNELDPATREQIRRMIEREGQLYPELMSILGYDYTPSDGGGGGTLTEQAFREGMPGDFKDKLDYIRKYGGSVTSGGGGTLTNRYGGPITDVPSTAQGAFEAETGVMNQLYPELMSSLSNFTLPPEALSFLDSLKNEQIGGIRSSIEDLIGGKVSNYANKGIISSSTSEGIGREAARAMEPTVSKAMQDYWQARLQLPSQLAQQKWSLGTSYGGQTADAYRKRLQDILGPIQNIWQVSAGQAATPQGSTSTSSTSTNPFAQIAGTAGMILPWMIGGPAGGMAAGAGAAATGACWVAEELFGKDDTRTHLARAWVAKHDNPFTRLYRRHGKTWAKIVKRHGWIKPLIAPAWDALWRAELRSLIKEDRRYAALFT